jgi:hypothetical protein
MNMDNRALPRIIACVVLGICAGCSTSASFSRQSGPAFDAEILGSDARSLHVRDEDGREFLVPREDVADIDHPGNVLGTIGAVLMAMSVPWFVAALNSERPQSHQSEWAGMELVFAIPTNPFPPVPRPATYLPNPYPPPYPTSSPYP